MRSFMSGLGVVLLAAWSANLRTSASKHEIYHLIDCDGSGVIVDVRVGHHYHSVLSHAITKEAVPVSFNVRKIANTSTWNVVTKDGRWKLDARNYLRWFPMKCNECGVTLAGYRLGSQECFTIYSDVNMENCYSLATPSQSTSTLKRVKSSSSCLKFQFVTMRDDRYKANIAFKKPTAQSSTFQGSDVDKSKANNSVDGITNGNYYSGSCSQTMYQHKETALYWWVDLEIEYHVDEIRIWNRKDCCQDRLSNLNIYLSSDKPVIRVPHKDAYECGSSGQLMSPYPDYIPVWCDGRKGRYVSIVKNGGGYITLCEVQVFDATACPCNKNGSPRCRHCQCLDEYSGKNCEKCENGYFGNAMSQGCRECRCSIPGAEDGVCNKTTGQCKCHEEYTGSRCHKCSDMYYRNQRTKQCEQCDCNEEGVTPQGCNKTTGQCECSPGYMGQRCDQCAKMYYQDSNSTNVCQRCDCAESGAKNQDCDKKTGQCECKEGNVGKRCEQIFTSATAPTDQP